MFQEDSVIRETVIIRPSLLVAGAAKGLDRIRVGWELEDGVRPAIGYTIRRADVGAWIFQECVRAEHGIGRWEGKKITLTS